MNVTGEQVKTVAMAAGITYVPHHTCSLCNHMVHYLIGHGEIWFDPSCDCIAGDGARPSTWDKAADWINMQTNEAVREEIKESFGFLVGSAPIEQTAINKEIVTPPEGEIVS